MALRCTARHTTAVSRFVLKEQLNPTFLVLHCTAGYLDTKPPVQADWTSECLACALKDDPRLLLLYSGLFSVRQLLHALFA